MADQAEETPKETPGSPTPAAPEAEVQQQDDEHGEGPVPKPEGEEKPDDGRGQDPTPKPEGDVKTEEPSGEQQEVVEAPAEQKEEEKTADETTEQQPAEESPQGGQTEGVEGEEGVTEGEGQKKVEETQAEQKEEDAKPEESTEQPKEETVQVPAPSPIQADQGTETDKTQEPEPDVDPSALSPRSKVNLEATATVKFVLMPSGQVVTQACTLGQTLEQLKQHFSMELKLPVTLIMIMFDGKTMPDSTTLADLGVGPNGTIQLELQSADPVNTPIKAYRPRQEYHMPDVITVRVQAVVEIERTTRKKPFLGGYRHKKSSVEYHHASAQTMQKPRPPPPFERFCRDTQTVEQKHRPQQTTNEMSTQMTGIGVFVSNREDKLLRPKQYTTADEYHLMILNRVIIIQKYYRRWLARQWRQEELERINTTLTAAERKAALCMLLDQETQLIAAIGRHKIEADSENKDKRIQDFLDKAAAPKKWKGFDGKGTEMDTPFTIRAKELRDIYNSINMKYLTQDERLDVLLTLKHTVKEHDCKLTQEIIELIDREADLLMRGVKETNLDGLRKRISTLFLQYLKTPTFNPEAAKLLKNIYFCPSCNSYLPSTEFAISSNSRNVGKCRRCTKIDNDARVRQDYSHYRYLLKQLRKAEQNYLDDSKIAFLLQEHDLRYLVDKVWGGQSILSAWDDLFDLTMVRWNKHEEWSPWNCILLTKDEAAAHDKLVNLEEGYGQVFIQKVQQKHVLARNYFSRMPGMAEHVKERASERDTRSGPSIQGQSVTVQ
ncbi:IQUB-like protein [Mya arenaria]|uniref:IQUB-like protein n=1 Tax=Mya arenaria TaxID=6604 RepID=A0ABY7FZ08_MYAAR|nr:IQUB-like protein [Mya arenaria]